jgi:hypothetical protein
MTYPPQPPPYGSNQPDPTRSFGEPPQPYQPPVVSGPPYQPPPQPYGTPPPGFYPPQPPTKKNKPLVWVLAGVGVLIGLCLVVGVIGNLTGANKTAGSGPTADATAGKAAAPATTGAKAKPAPKPKPALPGFGDPARDGKFEFVVSGMDCSKTTLGNDFLNTKAQGKFCVVSMSVKNIGDEPQTFTGGEQKAYDIGGAEFTNDGGAEFYANDNNQTFLNDINPGNKVNGKVVFDVPKQTTLTTIELHDSLFSGGVKVALK